MKQLLSLFLLAALLCALLCACGKPALSEADLSLAVSGVKANPKSDVSALLDALGPDYT